MPPALLGGEAASRSALTPAVASPRAAIRQAATIRQTSASHVVGMRMKVIGAGSVLARSDSLVTHDDRGELGRLRRISDHAGVFLSSDASLHRLSGAGRCRTGVQQGGARR